MITLKHKTPTLGAKIKKEGLHMRRNNINSEGEVRDQHA